MKTDLTTITRDGQLVLRDRSDTELVIENLNVVRSDYRNGGRITMSTSRARRYFGYIRPTVKLACMALLMTTACIGCPPERSGTRPDSWEKTLDRLSSDLFFFLNETGDFPHDKSGSDHALYRLCSRLGVTNADWNGRCGTDYLPFLINTQEGIVTDLRVEYLNPEAGTASHAEAPVVLFVKSFETENPQSILVMSSNLLVYRITQAATGMKKEASDYLGLPLGEMFPLDELRRVGGTNKHKLKAFQITHED